jgi:copper chaperone CopZ
MFSKSAATVPVAVFFSFLHVGCCILPLITVTAGSITYLGFFREHKSVFMFIQLVMLAYISVKLLRSYLGKNQFHGAAEKIAYLISLAITFAGLLIGYYEPFKTQDQKIAQQQFEFFKSHRQLEFDLSGSYDHNRLREDILQIYGVKPNRIRIHNKTVAVTFQSDKTSEPEILAALKEKGYIVLK